MSNSNFTQLVTALDRFGLTKGVVKDFFNIINYVYPEDMVTKDIEKFIKFDDERNEDAKQKEYKERETRIPLDYPGIKICSDCDSFMWPHEVNHRPSAMIPDEPDAKFIWVCMDKIDCANEETSNDNPPIWMKKDKQDDVNDELQNQVVEKKPEEKPKRLGRNFLHSVCPKCGENVIKKRLCTNCVEGRAGFLFRITCGNHPDCKFMELI